jgi:hypothetical protein
MRILLSYVAPVGCLALTFAACVGDEPGASSGGTAGDAGDAGVRTDSAVDPNPTTDASPEAATVPSYCASLVSYWKGDGNAADSRNKNPLAWYPQASDARYSPGAAMGPIYGDGGTSVAPFASLRLNPGFLESANPTTELTGLQAITVFARAHSQRNNVGNPYGALLCLNLAKNETPLATSGSFCLERRFGGIGVYFGNRLSEITLPSAGVEGSSDPWIGTAFHTLAVSVRGGTQGEIQTYWDGNSPTVTPANVPVPIAGPAPRIRVGESVAGIGGSGPFNGLIDDLAIFSSVLSEAELKDIRAKGITCP